MAPHAGLGLVEAFYAAVKLEDSLIEREVLVAHADDDPEVAAVLDTLREQTQSHRQHLARRSRSTRRASDERVSAGSGSPAAGGRRRAGRGAGAPPAPA